MFCLDDLFEMYIFGFYRLINFFYKDFVNCLKFFWYVLYILYYIYLVCIFIDIII